ncbi:MAG: PilN domain-containing protein [Pseudomonadota bacterium]|jgi:type IV pilus assembly protein PilN|nr:MAG: pilus assembly protein PilN [Pseudomonadota bacterium]
MPRINLLPWREQQRIERKKAFGVGMFAALVGAAAVAGVAWFVMNQMIDAQRDRNNRLRAEIRELDKKIEEINSLDQQKQQLIARMQIIETLQRSRPEIVHVFDTFPRIIPDGVYLTSMTQSGRQFKILGVTQSATRVSNFIRAIEGSEWLRYKGLEGIDRNNFTLNLEQVAAAAPAQASAPARANRQ